MNPAVQAYLDALPADRRAALEAVRAVINANVAPEIEEGIQYGMIGWYLPHAHYPHGYHCDPKQPLPYAGLAAQKGHMALYLMCAYLDPDTVAWLQTEAATRGCTLDMGKACIRAGWPAAGSAGRPKRAADLPLDLIGAAIARMTVPRFVSAYEANLPAAVKKKRG